ncbi:MAG: Mini-ribonuclease 3 [Clostridia bacterium]|nr:Mini-ribonuclease 3 [Clostridia bacterium]
MDKIKANNLNPVVLAFVGDAVYSLFVREQLTFLTDCKTGELNKLATKKVNAVAQAELVNKIIPLLTEEELSVFKRARNAKKPTKAKHASVSQYNLATGFEAVIGYLYILGEMERLNYLLNLGD